MQLYVLLVTRAHSISCTALMVMETVQRSCCFIMLFHHHRHAGLHHEPMVAIPRARLHSCITDALAQMTLMYGDLLFTHVQLSARQHAALRAPAPAVRL